MTQAQELAAFAAAARYDDLPKAVVDRLLHCVLDALAVGLAGAATRPVRRVTQAEAELGGSAMATVIGGEKTAIDRAALGNGFAIRYLDFNDSYLGTGETCHPSDNVAPVLAAAEFSDASGKEFLAALAVSYAVQLALSDVAPVRDRGFDHTTQGAYAAAAGAAKALGLDADGIANAVAMSATANNALRVTRTGKLSEWKGLAYPNTAMSATHCAWLASHGVTGPLEVLEGPKGFQESISRPFEINWNSGVFEKIRRVILKKHNAEVHSQSAIEAALSLRGALFPGDIEDIELRTFQVAYDIIGGGREGAKTDIQTKEQADHSLPYLIAVAFLDGEVLPAQYSEGRIRSPDVQSLLRKVRVIPEDEFTRRFPGEMPARLRVRLRDGRVVEEERAVYPGFHTQPMSWADVVAKFDRVAGSTTEPAYRHKIADAVARLPESRVRDLAGHLGRRPRTAFKRSA